MDLKTLLTGVPWDIVLLYGGGMAIAQGCQVITREIDAISNMKTIKSFLYVFITFPIQPLNHKKNCDSIGCLSILHLSIIILFSFVLCTP